MQRVQMDVIQLLHVYLLLSARRQVDERSLASTVARAVGDSHGAGPRCNVEHAPATPLSEVRHQEPHEVVRSMEVDGNVVNEVTWVLGVHLHTG